MCTCCGSQVASGAGEGVLPWSMIRSRYIGTRKPQPRTISGAAVSGAGESLSLRHNIFLVAPSQVPTVRIRPNTARGSCLKFENAVERGGEGSGRKNLAIPMTV